MEIFDCQHGGRDGRHSTRGFRFAHDFCLGEEMIGWSDTAWFAGCLKGLCFSLAARQQGKSTGTRNFLTFVNTTTIAYGQKIARSLRILVFCNSSRVYKRQEITSTVTLFLRLEPCKVSVLA